MYRPDELARTQQQADDLFSSVAKERTLYEVCDPAWPPLYKISRILNAYSTHIGYPELIVDQGQQGTESKQLAEDYCSLKVGDDNRFPGVYLWQIAMRHERSRATLHGRSARSGEAWQYVEFDHQGGKSSVYVTDQEGVLSGFVLHMIIDSGVVSVADEVLSAHLQHDTRHRLGSTGLSEIRSARTQKVDTGPNRGAIVHRQVNELPDWVHDILDASIDTIAISVSHPPEEKHD